MCVLQAAIDDSGSDQQGPVYVLSGYLAQSGEWAKFADEWDAKLKEPPAIKYFKMSHAKRLEGEFDGWERTVADQKVLSLSRVIPPHVMYNLECIVAQADYENVILPFLPVIRSSPAREDRRLARAMKNPYFFCFYGVITECMKKLADERQLEEIEFNFDDQGKMGRRTAVFWDDVKASAPPEFQVQMRKPPQFQSEQDFLPLQAADMIANLSRSRIDDAEHGTEELHEAFKILRTVKLVQNRWNAARLLEFINDHMLNEFDKFDATMKKLIRISHDEIKRKLDEERANKGKKRKAKKPSALGRASSDKD